MMEYFRFKITEKYEKASRFTKHSSRLYLQHAKAQAKEWMDVWAELDDKI